MNIDFAQVLPYLPVLLKAALMTIFLAVVTQVCGTVFGLVLALARDARGLLRRGVEPVRAVFARSSRSCASVSTVVIVR